MLYEQIEWDEANLDHATRHGISAREIEQANGKCGRTVPQATD